MAFREQTFRLPFIIELEPGCIAGFFTFENRGVFRKRNGATDHRSFAVEVVRAELAARR